MSLRSFSAEILHQMGLIGPSGSSSLVPRPNIPSQVQSVERDWSDNSAIASPDTWSKYATVMKRPTTIEQTFNLWEEMGTWDLMAAALSELVEEAVQADPGDPAALWYECNDSSFEEDLNDMVQSKVKADLNLPSQVWHIAALGNNFEKIEYARNDGVLGITHIHPTLVRRYWLEKNRRCIGFKWEGHQPDKSNVFVQADGRTEIPRTSLQTGNLTEQLWYPWDFLHFRRMFRMRSSEYGEALYDEAQGIYKKLRMAVDQMVVHRAQIQPDRYVINIDVKDQPPTEQMRTIQRWKQTMRNKMSFGPGTTTDTLGDPSEFRSFYNPLALDTVMWMAMPRDFKHSVEKLTGTATIPDVYDIELLTDLFYSIIGMPKAWFGIGADPGAAPSGKSLLAQDIRFLRKVKAIRRPIIEQYTWLGYFHAILKGKTSIEDLNIRVRMSDIGGLEDQMKLELLDLQSDILLKLGDVMTSFNLPKDAWMELIFRRYLRLPDEVINVFMTALPPKVEVQPMESRNDAPAERRIIEQVERAITGSADLRRSVFKINKAARRLSPDRKQRAYKKIEDVLSLPDVSDQEHVRISMDQEPMIIGLNPKDTQKPTTIRSILDSKSKTKIVESNEMSGIPGSKDSTLPNGVRDYIKA